MSHLLGGMALLIKHNSDNFRYMTQISNDLFMTLPITLLPLPTYITGDGHILI